jgi:ribosomal protein S18 acetylase RimI-like enzyme
MIIRQATLQDSETIAAYLLLAMEDIVYQFIREVDKNKAKDFLLYFVKRGNNQYSYQNCLVAEDGNEVVAALNLYDGSKLCELREPVVQYIKARFNRDFHPEDETQPGEYYIDSLGVNPAHQGKGIGSEMLRFVINKYVIQKNHTLGLLVEEENPSARKLYLKLGFKPAGRMIFLGKRMEHLQLKA